jgi:hypothetical protein
LRFLNRYERATNRIMTLFTLMMQPIRLSESPFTQYHVLDGAGQDHEVQPDRPVPHVVSVHPDSVVKVALVAPGNLLAPSAESLSPGAIPPRTPGVGATLCRSARDKTPCV